jgi:hypothetical protein
MKKFGMVLLLMVLLGGACATVSPRVAMTPNDLSWLKGEWEGSRDITFDRLRSVDFTRMEIFNDSIPLKGKMTIAFMGGSDTRRYSFENGFIDGNGNLSIDLSEADNINLSLYREGNKTKLEGSFNHRENMGKLTLYKK